jgi:hypothetical protein
MTHRSTEPRAGGSNPSGRAEDLFRNVDKSGGPDACWPWPGRVDRDGYGLGGGGRVHRIVCAAYHGLAPFPGAHACHSTACTTRRCCNPDHLRWDTPAGNQADVALVGSRRGIKHPLAKLTEDQVREIWTRRAEGYVRLARKMGLSPGAVRHVVYGVNWTHITRAVAPVVSAASAAGL